MIIFRNVIVSNFNSTIKLTNIEIINENVEFAKYTIATIKSTKINLNKFLNIIFFDLIVK